MSLKIDNLKEAISTLLCSWGGDTPPEAIWAYNDLQKFLQDNGINIPEITDEENYDYEAIEQAIDNMQPSEDKSNIILVQLHDSNDDRLFILVVEAVWSDNLDKLITQSFSQVYNETVNTDDYDIDYVASYVVAKLKQHNYSAEYYYTYTIFLDESIDTGFDNELYHKAIEDYDRQYGINKDDSDPLDLPIEGDLD